MVGWLAARVPGEQVIATQDPAHIHLYSGQKTVGFVETAGASDEWRRLGVRFFAETHYRTGIDPTGRESDPALAAFTPVYRTPSFDFRVLDLGRLYGSRRVTERRPSPAGEGLRRTAQSRKAPLGEPPQ